MRTGEERPRRWATSGGQRAARGTGARNNGEAGPRRCTRWPPATTPGLPWAGRRAYSSEPRRHGRSSIGKARPRGGRRLRPSRGRAGLAGLRAAAGRVRSRRSSTRVTAAASSRLRCRYRCRCRLPFRAVPGTRRRPRRLWRPASAARVLRRRRRLRRPAAAAQGLRRRHLRRPVGPDRWPRYNDFLGHRSGVM